MTAPSIIPPYVIEKPVPDFSANPNPVFTLIRPFQDPVGTFRAHAISDMFLVVPSPRTTYEYSVGEPPNIRPTVFTIQNRTISNTLEVKLTLPDYLRVIIGNIGPIAAPKANPFVFHVGARGDTTTFPIAIDPPILAAGSASVEFQRLAKEAFAAQNIFIQENILQPVSFGNGLVNIVVTFDEEQATEFFPGDFLEPIIFDVSPLDVTGPVYVDVNAGPPVDLNPLLDVTQSLNVPAVSGSSSENIVEVPVIVEVEVPVSDNQPRWIDGTDGLLKDGTPPEGWIIAADGRAYPPIPPVDPCATGQGPASETGLNGMAASSSVGLTPLEVLVFETKNIPESFIGATRRGFIIDAPSFLEGTDPARVSNRTIDLIVADIGSEAQFKVINWKKAFVDSSPVPVPDTDPLTKDFFTLFATSVPQTRTGSGQTFFKNPRQWVVTSNVQKMIKNNTKFSVPSSLPPDSLQLARSIAMGASIVHNINVNGVGTPVKKP